MTKKELLLSQHAESIAASVDIALRSILDGETAGFCVLLFSDDLETSYVSNCARDDLRAAILKFAEHLKSTSESVPLHKVN